MYILSRFILVSLMLLGFYFCVPTNVFADTSPYRSAGWVGTDTGRDNPYTNLTNCSVSDGQYCSHPSAPGSMNLYFSSFGNLSDFGIPQGSTITRVHFRVKGKNTVTQWIQMAQGRNKPLATQCQSPFDLWQVFLGSTDTTKELHTTFTSSNFLATCFTPAIINEQNFTVALFFNGHFVNNWSADIDNFEIAFDYIPGPTPTPTPKPTAIPTPTPIPTPAPFLDLPWDYESKDMTFNDAALSITSYFDHQYPLLSAGLQEPGQTDNSIVSFQGFPENAQPYSSHDGYDYANKARVHFGDSVLAAAAGWATYVNTCRACGNTIKIDHENGFQTRYFHMQYDGLVTTAPGQKVWVNDRQPIGKVGATGNVVPKNNSGAHIHFEVVHDKDKDGNFENNVPDGFVDPFGWEPYVQENKKNPDPWEHYAFTYFGKDRTGSKSNYLWKKKLLYIAETVTSSGGEYKTEDFSLRVDPGTFSGPTNLQMNHAPSQKASDSIWSIGPVMNITAQNLLGDAITILTKPVHLIWYPFRDADLARFKSGSFYLYSSKDGEEWTKETQVDPFMPGDITAAASHFTYFAIMGERKDIQAPKTSALLAGSRGKDNWYRSDVIISLNSEDKAEIDPAGVEYILYKLDDNDWQTYTGPITISSIGSHTVSFYSGDKDGNVEDIQTQTFSIDKTAPEALIAYDLSKFDIVVSGIDQQSQTSVKTNSTLIATMYEVTDQAGNSIVLQTDKILLAKQNTLRINTIRYNTNSVVSLDKNLFFTLVATDAQNKVLQLDQYYSLKDDKKIFTNYSFLSNSTKISTKASGTNGYTHESKPGIVLLQLQTENGKLKYSY